MQTKFWCGNTLEKWSLIRLQRWKGNINTDVSEIASEYKIWMKPVKMNFGISNTKPSGSATSVIFLVIELLITKIYC